jgi:hypothetical protein
MAASTQFVVVVANPASATDWSYTNTTGNPLLLQTVSALFTASANVASRQPSLFISTPANRVGVFGVNATIVASQVARYVFGAGLPAAAAVVNSPGGVSPTTYPLPTTVYVPPNGQVFVVTAAIAAGDQWSDIVLGFSA